MAFTYGFYNSLNGDRKYNAFQMTQMFDGIILDGVFEAIGQHFAVTAAGGMTVNVGTGRAWFNHTWNDNDSVLPITLPLSDLNRSRYDAVVIEVGDPNTNRTNEIKIVSGETAVNPVKPVLNRGATNNDTLEPDSTTLPPYQHALAYILVKPGVEEIAASDIEVVVGKDETPFVTGPLETRSIEELFNQWDAQFNTWFNNLKAQLSDNVVTNLQLQIDQRVKYSDKASEAEILSVNPPSNKWVSADGLKQYEKNNSKDVWFDGKHYRFCISNEIPYSDFIFYGSANIDNSNVKYGEKFIGISLNDYPILVWYKDITGGSSSTATASLYMTTLIDGKLKDTYIGTVTRPEGTSSFFMQKEQINIEIGTNRFALVFNPNSSSSSYILYGEAPDNIHLLPVSGRSRTARASIYQNRLAYINNSSNLYIYDINGTQINTIPLGTTLNPSTEFTMLQISDLYACIVWSGVLKKVDLLTGGVSTSGIAPLSLNSSNYLSCFIKNEFRFISEITSSGTSMSFFDERGNAKELNTLLNFSMLANSSFSSSFRIDEKYAVFFYNPGANQTPKLTVIDIGQRKILYTISPCEPYKGWIYGSGNDITVSYSRIGENMCLINGNLLLPNAMSNYISFYMSLSDSTKYRITMLPSQFTSIPAANSILSMSKYNVLLGSWSESGGIINYELNRYAISGVKEVTE